MATQGRLRAGGGPIQPDPALGHAANFLYMLTGRRPSALATHAFDVALILHADHELNASTFAARVTAATLSDIHSAIVSAIGTLKGPLHGGANAEVMNLVEKVSAFKFQTMALSDAEAGNIAAATRKLQSAATVLLNMGEDELAEAAEQEILSLKKTGNLTSAGTKKLEYGTRKLTQVLRQAVK